MGVSISPGGTIVFALLGDIYTLPLAGGSATRITSGMAYDFEPTFSPDGENIAFVSDRNGEQNIWVMNADGANPRMITTDRVNRKMEEDARYPEWSPDGKKIIFVRDGAAWVSPREGGPAVKVADAASTQTFRWSPDGQYLFTDNNGVDSIYRALQIKQLDIRTKKGVEVTSTPIGGERPAISPDGKTLVYAVNVDGQSGLRIYDLASRSDEWLLFPIDFQDTKLGWEARPRFDFTPDGRSVVLAKDGTFYRVDIASRRAVVIKFSARVEQSLAPFVYNEYRIPDGPLVVRAISSVSENSSGTQLLFNALGKIWVMDLPSGKPTPLVDQKSEQFDPMFSPDGSHVAYVTWDDLKQEGQLWSVPARGGTPRQLSPSSPNYRYLRPSWSRDGRKVAFFQRRPSPNWDIGDMTIAWMPSEGGAVTTVLTEPLVPNGPAVSTPILFSEDGKRIFYQARKDLISVGLDGSKQTIAKAIRDPSIPAAADVVVLSPDGQWIAYQIRENIFVGKLPSGTGTSTTATAPTFSEEGGAGGAFLRVTTEGGVDVRWTVDGKALTWSFANRAYRVALAALFNDDGTTKTFEPVVRSIPLTVPRRQGQGTIALSNVRIVTMNGTNVIPSGDILITNNRIAAVGAKGAVAIPRGAHVIDLSGKTVIPGLIDMHAHGIRGWRTAANLAYGVTTARATADNNVDDAELIEAGAILGPRLFVSGYTLSPSHAGIIKNLEDARARVRQRTEQGAIFLKEYTQPTRRSRQWLVQAANEAGVNITAETGVLSHSYTMVLDGYTGVEHSVAGLLNYYDDVIQLRARARTWYTPTLQSQSMRLEGLRNGGRYFYQFSNPHDDAKLARFTPHYVLDKDTRVFEAAHLGEHTFLKNGAVGAIPLIRAGGNVTAGSHAEQIGIGVHWEMWLLQLAGASNYEALRTATSAAAAGLGLQRDLGSIEVGKIADFLVLDADPLANIRNTNTIRYVMKNGELFDGNDLSAVWPTKRAAPFLFQDPFAPPAH